jgi:hypothetical protein
LIQDQIRFWRWKNQVKMVLKAKGYFEARGIEPSKIRWDILVPLLEAGADAEDETLADMFAGLLSSHLDPATSHDVHPGYAKVLAQLSPFEAWLLQGMYESLPEGNDRRRALPIELAIKVAAKHEPPVSEQIVRVSYHNLWRLGLCDRGNDPLADMNRVERISITPFGWTFLEACLPGARARPPGDRAPSEVNPVAWTPRGKRSSKP